MQLQHVEILKTYNLYACNINLVVIVTSLGIKVSCKPFCKIQGHILPSYCTCRVLIGCI